MELKTFVSESLLQIVQGVLDSANEIAAMGGAVSPVYHSVQSERFLGTTKGKESLPVFSVDFDVALTTVRETGQEGTETLRVVSVASTSSTSTEQSAEQTFSRLRFMVPLQLPPDPTSKQSAAEAEQRADARRRQSVNRQVPNWQAS